MKRNTLTPARQRLILLLGEVRFGRIEHLQIRGGDPVWEPLPRVLCTRKFGLPPTPTRPGGSAVYRRQTQELLSVLEELRDGVIELIEIHDGLPFLAEVLHRSRLLDALDPHLAPHPQSSPDGLTLLESEDDQ